MRHGESCAIPSRKRHASREYHGRRQFARMPDCGADLPVRIVQAEAEALPFADKRFDIGTCVRALEATRDPVHSLAESRRIGTFPAKNGALSTIKSKGEFHVWFVPNRGPVSALFARRDPTSRECA